MQKGPKYMQNTRNMRRGVTAGPKNDATRSHDPHSGQKLPSETFTFPVILVLVGASCCCLLLACCLLGTHGQPIRT